MPRKSKNPRAISPDHFIGRKVILEDEFWDGTPRWKDPLTDEQASEVLDKMLAYKKGVDYRDVRSIMDSLAAFPERSELRREKADELWGKLKPQPKPARSSPDAQRKFLSRVHPSGKSPVMGFIRRCVVCKHYFPTDSRKTKHCSTACRTSAEARPDGYFAEKQRDCRAEKVEKRRRAKPSIILAAWRERQRKARS